MVWNRQRFRETPKPAAVARPNPRSEWITKAVPELRIIDDECAERAGTLRDGAAEVVAGA